MVAEGAGITVVDPFSALSFYSYGGVVLRSFHPEVKFVVNVIRPVSQPVPLIVDEFLSYAVEQKKTMDRQIAEILKKRSKHG